jgi:RNA polymerase sigma factor (sigma-70 family)
MTRERASLAAIEAVYRRRGGDFYRFALARTGNGELAHDAVQEGFARAIRARHGFRGTGSLEGWLARCVLNAARDVAAATMPTPEGAGVASFTLEDTDDDVRAAVRRLPVRQRDALFLRFYLDFDYATIAEVLGVEVGTVSATLHAARDGLRRALEEVLR